MVGRACSIGNISWFNLRIWYELSTLRMFT
jgi:hypothetical protein